MPSQHPTNRCQKLRPLQWVEEPDQEQACTLRLAVLTVLQVEGAGCAQFTALGGSRDRPSPSAWIAVGLWEGRGHQAYISILEVPSHCTG